MNNSPAIFNKLNKRFQFTIKKNHVNYESAVNYLYSLFDRAVKLYHSICC